MHLKFSLIVLAFLAQIFISSANVHVEKGVNYAGNADENYTLNVYYKKDGLQNHDVVIFIHGGSWSSGKKETYWWLGRNFAKKGLVTAIINYPLAPNAAYKEMALASAKAVKWVRDNISRYGGDSERIFLMGHSAGAHLCELINADHQYFSKVGIVNPVRGLILNDAFGLDMDEYLTKAEKADSYTDFLRTFSAEKKNWQLGSPLYYVKNIKNPHLIFYGSKTFPAIQLQSTRMEKLLKAQHTSVELEVIEGKRHVGMMAQMIFGCNKLYEKILLFLKDN